jgi:pilin isopeptide linkage protein
MNFTKFKKCIVPFVMALLLVVGLLPLQALATEKQTEDTDARFVDFELELDIQGETPPEPAMFTFILEPDDDNEPLPENSTVSIEGAGEACFGEIEFTEPGEYHYTVYERDDGLDNYTYDDSVYELEVDVTYDNYGDLVASVTAYDAVTRQAKESGIMFINTYSDLNPVPEGSTTTTQTSTTGNNKETTTGGTTEKTTSNKKTTTNINTTTKTSKSTSSNGTTTSATDKDTTNSNSSPYTGDNFNLNQWIAIMCIAGVGLVSCLICLKFGKKHDKNNEIM